MSLIPPEKPKEAQYSLALADLRAEIIERIERAHPATLRANASVLGVKE
jgi:hypothetical protein